MIARSRGLCSFVFYMVSAAIRVNGRCCRHALIFCCSCLFVIRRVMRMAIFFKYSCYCNLLLLVVVMMACMPSVHTLSVFHFVQLCSNFPCMYRQFFFFFFVPCFVFFLKYMCLYIFWSASDWALAVLAGVLAGCGGMFLPGDRGLSPLSSGVPWGVQSALLGSACYCYASVFAGTYVHAQSIH